MAKAIRAVTLPVLAAGCILANNADAAAQEPRDTFELAEIVVTVTRLPIPREAAAAHVTVITGEELRARGVDHVLEAFRTLPGAAVVQSGSFGGATSLFLRGGESDYVQVLVDGVPVNEPGGAFNFATLTADNVERIEVVRGPASALYGSDAMTGVVQIFTRRGEGAPRVSLGFKAGTFGTVGWNADLSGGGEATEYAFSLSRFSSDGILEFNNDYQNTVLSGRVGLNPDPRTEAALTFRYSDHEFHVPTDGAGNLVDENAFEFGDALTLGLELAQRFSDRIKGHLLLTTHERNGGFDDRPDGRSDTLGFFAFQSLDNVRRRTADARADVHLAENAILTAGIEVEEETQRSFNESDSEFGPDNGSFPAERWNRAYYGQIFADLASRLALTGGARLEDNDAFGSFATYRAGAAYHTPGGTRLRASIGTALKEPSFFENFAAGFVLGNPDLDPERSRSWEIGLEQSFASGLGTLSATFFDQRFRDLIQFTPVPPDSGDPNFFNVAAAEARGVETGLSLGGIPRLTLAVDYTYLDTEVTDPGFQSAADFLEGERLLRRPTHSARIHAGYLLSDRGSVALDVHHVGERDDLDFSGFPFQRVVLPAYTRVDLAAQYEPYAADSRLPALTLTLRLDNALDRSYEEVKNFPARGRTLFLGGRVEF
ncbi:MAG: TonB-dependent receptor plug domain-containing protein [Gemmatimonadota bacterium]